jgi:hypothetical protein
MELDRKDPLVAQDTKRMVEKRKSDYLRVARGANFAGYIKAKTEGMFITFEILQ